MPPKAFNLSPCGPWPGILMPHFHCHVPLPHTPLSYPSPLLTSRCQQLKDESPWSDLQGVLAHHSTLFLPGGSAGTSPLLQTLGGCAEPWTAPPLLQPCNPNMSLSPLPPISVSTVLRVPAAHLLSEVFAALFGAARGEVPSLYRPTTSGPRTA